MECGLHLGDRRRYVLRHRAASVKREVGGLQLRSNMCLNAVYVKHKASVFVVTCIGTKDASAERIAAFKVMDTIKREPMQYRDALLTPL